MTHSLGDVRLRLPEARDREALYAQKNDQEVADLLGGFCAGYSLNCIDEWIQSHRRRSDEVLWVIADAGEDRCIGHVGLYKIDHRIRSAEFAIMLGEKSAWGRGLGRRVSAFVIGYGFDALNLNRIHLTVIATNTRARKLYESLGFQLEGTLRQAQYRHGGYIDMHVMSLLRQEHRRPVEEGREEA